MFEINKNKIIYSAIITGVLLLLYINFDILFMAIAIVILLLSLLNKWFSEMGVQISVTVLIVSKVVSFLVTETVNALILLSIVLIIQVLNYVTVMIMQRQKYERFIEEKILIAKKNMIETNETFILIAQGEKLVWANARAYDEFPFLLRNQTIERITDNVHNGVVEIDNKFYSVKEEEEIYYLLNVTNQEREIKKLVDLQLIVGIVQIDNHVYLGQTMDRSDFLEMDTKIKLQLIEWFKSEKMYYQEIGDDKFQINIPYTTLQNCIEEKFIQITNIIDPLKEENFDVSLSMGIAYNYATNLEIGQMANEALELANSRGGAQTVIFNNGKRTYFGGKISNSKSNIHIRSRFVYNTIENNTKNADIIYLVAHQNADYDALSSMILVANLLKEYGKEIKVMVDKNSKRIILENAKKLVADEMLFTDTVVDMTKNNLLIVVDTQSPEYISHPKLYDEIGECIVIDHHQTPEKYMNQTLFTWVEPTASSTTELILSMYLSTNNKINNKDVAMLAMLAIITDTNNLKFRIASSTIDAIGFLINEKATLIEAMEQLEISKDDYLYKKQILQEVEMFEDYSLLEIDYEIEDDLHAIIANELIEVKEMYLVAVICKVTTDKYKLKMRTNGKLNAKGFLEEFGGGGHARQAAGVFGYDTIQAIKEKINKLKFEE